MNKFKYMIIPGVVILSVISLNVPKSTTKFISEQDKTLVYGATVKDDFNVLRGEINRLDSSTTRYAHLSYSFSRNKETLSKTNKDNLDVYKVTIPDGCSNLSFNTSGNYYVDYSLSEGRITYDNSFDDTVSIKMSCNVNKLRNDEVLSTQIKIKEEIGDVVIDPYMILTYKESVDSYPFVKLENINTLSVELSDTYNLNNLWNDYDAWIKDFAKASGDEVATKDYLGVDASVDKSGTEYFKSPDELINQSKIDSRLGLDLSVEGNKYTYTIDVENILGYVKTYKTGSNLLYFSSKEKVNINEAFEEYLEYYLYPGVNNSGIRASIVNYVNTILPNGIYSIINKELDEDGNLYVVDGIDINNTDDKSIYVLPNLAVYADSFVNSNELRFKYVNNDATLLRMNVMASIMAIDSNLISDTLKQSIRADYGSSLVSYLVLDPTNPFVYYVTLYDEENKQNVVFTIYSDGSDEYTHVVVDAVSGLDGVELKFANNATVFQVTVGLTPNDEEITLLDNVISSVDSIDTFLEKREDIANLLKEVSAITGDVTIYKVSKELVDDVQTGRYLLQFRCNKIVPGTTGGDTN